MAYCPAGHTSTAADYCDQCGLPIESGGGAPPARVVAEAPAGAVCANCGVANAPDALFCEACGYDFTTGTPPRSAASPVPAESPAPEPAESPGPAEAAESPDAEPGELPQTWGGAGGAANWTAPGGDEEPVAAAPAESEEPQPAARPARRRPSLSDWVAEVWIDPDWYKTQGSTDPLPSPGLPEVIALRASTALIGRTSASRNIHPDIDCAIDTGVSRRHAQVSTDGTRWWIEDLESANGTFIGSSAGPLPSMPIGRGRVEFAPDQRIYLGGWTRIVIRPATEDEHEAFTASPGRT